jgi:CRP-like cAMP-binding protein
VSKSLLSPLPIFQGLDDATLEALAADIRSHFVEARQVIAHKGDSVSAVIIVARGRVQIATVTKDGDCSVLGFLGPGALIGDAAVLDQGGVFLDDGAFAVSATAQEDCLFLAIDRSVFLQHMESNVRLACNVARALARRLRMMIVRDAWLTSLDVPSRLARFILWLAGQEGVCDGGQAQLGLRVPQEQLGALIGATRESVNKHLRDWSRLGIVEHAGGRIMILDLPRLRAISEQSLEALSLRAAKA